MDILQKVFSAELIKTATSDEEFEKIEASVSVVAKLLASRPTEYVGALYLAAGAGQGESPLLSEVFELVKKKWRTVVMRYPSFPTQMLRAILLCAIVKLASEKDEFAAAIGLILPNLQRYVTGKEDVIALWQYIADEFQRKYEESSERQWSVPASVKLPTLELSDEASREFEMKRKGLNSSRLASAILPALTDTDSESGEEVENGNPHQPQSGGPWARHAANEIAAVLSGPVAQGLASEISAPDTQALANELGDHLEIVVSRLLSAVVGQDMRTRLLWWKESGYSPSARSPYRNMQPVETVLHAVADLATWLPNYAPPSAFRFVHDALPFHDGAKVQIDDLLVSDASRVVSSLHGTITNQWSTRTLLEVVDPATSDSPENFLLTDLVTQDPKALVEHLLREVLALRVLSGVKPVTKPRS
ncbi:GTPase-associated system all-helical protein GASH [Euryhalocaulis caribicus]|uniref:GTPase-associated system all-helical protein GASH n=1 Tax=Euryhalocaulis caribicus TaxID=1161401 RepID=UPI0003A8AB07|nr:GTPase-associated system all-helical protein GASH [Euryhalocaulis caribicus]